MFTLRRHHALNMPYITSEFMSKRFAAELEAYLSISAINWPLGDRTTEYISTIGGDGGGAGVLSA
jgi:hypothetical protein